MSLKPDLRLNWRLCLLLFSAVFLSPAWGATPRDLPKVSARAWLLKDINSGYVLSSYNEHLPLHPGGLTKLMTGYTLFRYLAANNIPLNREIAIDGSVQTTSGPRIFLQPGDRVRTDSLFTAMFVHSANDAALALANEYSDSEKKLVDKMNRQARVLGMTRTRFTNSTGLPDTNQASTAADLSILAQAIIRQFPQHQDIFKTRKIRHYNINYFNRNAMLWRDSSASGLMASPYQNTGYNLVATSEKNNLNLAVVILGASNEQRLFEAAQALIDYGRRNYETTLLYPARKVLADIPVDQGDATDVPVGMPDNLYVTLPHGEFDQLQARLEVEPQLTAPVQQGEDAGSLKLIFKERVIAEYPLVALEPIAVGNAIQKAWGDFRNWLRQDTGNRPASGE